jgi:hypothetical protein
MRPVTIVVLAKYSSIFEKFFFSTEKFSPLFDKIVVIDGNEVIITSEVKNWKSIQGPEKFSMAGNGNIGLKAVPLDHDILYTGDDVRFLEPKTIERLQEIAYKDPTIGILSPRLIGRGSPTLINPSGEICEVKPLEMWFPCVYIKREVIEKIGYLDEDFNNFGSDDLDFCIRTKMAGYKLACTSKVAIIHEASPEGGPTTFCKNIGAEEWRKQEQASYSKLEKKYGVTQNAFTRFMTTGDMKYLEKPKKTQAIDISNMDTPPTHEEVAEFFKSRHIHLATPCYGGVMTVNYTNSVLSLMNLTAETGIKMDISFLYNESLINRARNRMVAEAREKELFTDFFFIDADIGFNPRDILALLLYDKDIIGAPCVRKNLRLDRVVAATKKQMSNRVLAMHKEGSSIEEIAAAMRNGHEDYSQDQLEEMIGEYILNWPPGKIPSSMKLDRLLEVQDVGTGLMRIKKETFDSFEQYYPERTFMSLAESKGMASRRSKMFMFFQSRLDEDSKKNNAEGLPDYIPEDFAFCRDARKAGMSVWIAPWMKTTHLGVYTYKGDLMMTAESSGGLR